MYNQGEIIVVPFPFSNLSSVKQRPVLILSKTQDIPKSQDIVTCGITSNLKDTSHSVLIENKDLLDGVIPLKSRIKVDKLFTVEKSIVIKSVARLNKETFAKVREEFCRLV